MVASWGRSKLSPQIGVVGVREGDVCRGSRYASAVAARNLDSEYLNGCPPSKEPVTFVLPFPPERRDRIANSGGELAGIYLAILQNYRAVRGKPWSKVACFLRQQQG